MKSRRFTSISSSARTISAVGRSPPARRMARRFRILRDELYFVAAEPGRYRVEDKVSDVGPGDLLLCASHVAHGFEGISEDFSVWVLFLRHAEK